MGQILARQKLVLQNFEIHPVQVPVQQGLSVKQVLKVIRKQPNILKYLPDDPSLKEMTKNYLFGLLNTLDPTFFYRLLNEVDSKSPKKAKKEQASIVID